MRKQSSIIIPNGFTVWMRRVAVSLCISSKQLSLRRGLGAYICRHQNIKRMSQLSAVWIHLEMRFHQWLFSNERGRNRNLMTICLPDHLLESPKRGAWQIELFVEFIVYPQTQPMNSSRLLHSIWALLEPSGTPLIIYIRKSWQKQQKKSRFNIILSKVWSKCMTRKYYKWLQSYRALPMECKCYTKDSLCSLWVNWTTVHSFTYISYWQSFSSAIFNSIYQSITSYKTSHKLQNDFWFWIRR